MIDPVVVCGYGPQDLRIAGPHDEAAPHAEVVLDVVVCSAAHLRYEPARSDAVLPVNYVEVAVLDLLPGHWLLRSVRQHDAQRLAGLPFRQVQEVDDHGIN